MNRLYKTNKLYIIKLAQVTSIEESGWHTCGTTHFQPLPEVYFAILKDNGLAKRFKLVTKNMTVYADSRQTKNAGDFFAYEQHSVGLKINTTQHKYLSTKKMAEMEMEYNKSLNQSKNTDSDGKSNTK